MNPVATLVDLTITATRLPLALFERVRGEEVPATWPPVLLVNTVDAAILQAAGGLLHDERLTARAQLLRTSVDRAVEADRLAVEAERTRQRADDELAERRQKTDAHERSAEQRLAEERRRVEQANNAEERQVRERAAARDKEAAREEREAERARIAAERKALKAERKAATAESAAVRLDDAVDDAKKRRAAKRAAS